MAKVFTVHCLYYAKNLEYKAQKPQGNLRDIEWATIHSRFTSNTT